MDDINELKEQYRKWIVMQGTDHYKLSENDRGNVELETDYAMGYVNFYDDIVELRIETIRDKETVFFLHFQLHDLAKAEEQFNEMKETLIHQKDKQGVKILLCCTSGLTTSYFAELLNKASDSMKYNYNFKAANYQRVYEEGFGYDVILLAPQIAYERKKMQNALKGALVMSIPSQIFATYSCGKLIDLVRAELSLTKKRQTTNVQRTLRFFENNQKILAIGIINSGETLRIQYRYYRNGHQVTTGETLKKNVQMEDIEDVIDYVLKDFPEVEQIGVGVPGTVENGKLYWRDLQAGWLGVEKILREKYHRDIYIFNDANMIVTGIYWLEDEYRNLMLYFQPVGNIKPGCGIVINGHLLKGKKDIAGEAQYTQKVLSLSRPASELTRDPSGSEELMVKTLVPMISTIGPEAVFIYNQMTPDMDQLKEDLCRYIPQEYLPDFIYLEEITEYMMTGIYLRTIWKIQDAQRMAEGIETFYDKNTGELN
jgi:cellobiose-specific phosphotransferase system component IIB